MENVTIGQIIAVIGSLTVLSGFFFGIYKFIKKMVLDKIESNSKAIELLKEDMKHLKKEVTDSKEERLILLKGQLACLKGLQELKCDGPVTQGIKDIEEYMMKKSHN